MNKQFIVVLVLFFQLASVLHAQDFNSHDSIAKLNGMTVDTVYISLATRIFKNYADENSIPEGIVFLREQMSTRKNEPFKHQNLLVLSGRAFYQAKDYDRSLHYLDSVLNSGISFLTETEAKLYRLKGQNYYRKQEFAKALENYKQSLAALKKGGDKTQMDDVLSAIGTVYFEIDNLPDALRYAKEAEKISLETHDLDSRSRILNTIGNINKTLGNFEDAKKNYEDAFAVSTKTGDMEGMILTTTSMAMIEMHLKNFKEAWSLQEKAYEYARKLNNKHYLGGVYMSFARIRWEEENLEEAKSYYQLSVDMAGETSDRKNIALGNANLGFLLAEQKNHHKSNEYLRIAYPHAEAMGDLALLREIYGGFYDNYKALNRPEEALHYHELYKSYTDSVLNDEKSRELSNLKTQFAVEEKEKELLLLAEKEKSIADSEIKRQKLLKNFSIVGVCLLLVFAVFVFQRYRERHHTSLLLEEKNKSIASAYADLKNTQEELVETEKQREAQSIRVRIARDIHDEIGSGLTKITMLSDVMRKKLPQTEMTESLSKITSYSKNVTSSLSEIVWAINPGHDNVSSLVQYMKSTAGNLLEDSGISYSLHFPEKEIETGVHPEVKRNIFLVMKEAINNSLKYSEAGKIQVTFAVIENNFKLVVEDNGKGFHPLPYDQGRGESGNGLFNMHQRMQQHGNTFQVISSPGNGCKIIAEGKLI